MELLHTIDELLNFKFSTLVRKLLPHLPPEQTHKKYIDAIRNNPEKATKLLKKLLFSLNNLHNLDNHSMTEIAVWLQSTVAQDLLSVKHVNVPTIRNNIECKRENPKLTRTRIYKPTDKIWIRVISNYTIDYFDSLLTPYDTYLYTINLTNKTKEIYFENSRQNLSQIVTIINNAVEKIIFCSDLIFINENCEPYTAISNIMSFYYCYLTFYLDLVVKTERDWIVLTCVTVSSILFYNKNNFQTFNENTDAPLACFSGFNPFISLFRQLKKNKSKIYELVNDREFRALGYGSMCGGRTRQEIIFQNVTME